jgi:hypothetical protein
MLLPSSGQPQLLIAPTTKTWLVLVGRREPGLGVRTVEVRVKEAGPLRPQPRISEAG